MYVVDVVHGPERGEPWHGLHFLGDEQEVLRYKREATALVLGAMVGRDFEDERLDWVLQGLASPANKLGGRESELLLQIIAGSETDGEVLGYASQRYEAIMLAGRLGHMTSSQVLEELELICETDEGYACRNDGSMYLTSDGMFADDPERFPFRALFYDDHPRTMSQKAGDEADALGLHHYTFKLNLLVEGNEVRLAPQQREQLVIGKLNGDVFEPVTVLFDW